MRTWYWSRPLLLAGLFAGLLFAGQAAAQGAVADPAASDPAPNTVVSREDAAAIQQVIRAQLDAFIADDAAKAYSFASPGIRGMFRTPEIFLDMVRRGYPVVYRPAGVVFLKAEKDGDEVLQPVQMTDAAGQLWLALYTMQRQSGGAWLTNGCRLGRSQGQVT